MIPIARNRPRRTGLGRAAPSCDLIIAPTLAALLPNAAETALLRACLHSGESARDGWRHFLSGRAASGATLCAELAKWRTLLPLLERSAASSAIDVTRDVRSYLRATALREELRAVRFREIVAFALRALEDASVMAIAVRGAALAATVYDAWPLRHCHDLDLIVDDVDGAAHALARTGFTRKDGTAAPRVDAMVEHVSGLQVALHTRPFAVSYYDAGSFTRASRHITLEDGRMRIPSPEATLVHVLGHATCSSSRRNLRWVADAWHVVTRHSNLDWDDVLTRISAHRLELPVSVLLGYLADFGMPVPAGVLSRVRERAASADRLAEDVALGGVAAAMQGDVIGIWRSTHSWRGRFRLARWAVAPTPAYLRGASSVPAGWLIPLYLYRPARFVAGKLRPRPGNAVDEP